MGKHDVEEYNQFESLVKGLIEVEYGCCDNFLSPATVTGLLANMVALQASGSMKDAGVGNKLAFQKNNLIRSDKINWIEGGSTNQDEASYIAKVTRFVDHLNATCFTSIRSFESHYASYGKGNFYARHIDQFKGEPIRKFSIVLYLNQDWLEEDEGMLSLYPIDGVAVNIAPIGGRLVFFRSDNMDHEVHPSLTRERNSIAGWFKSG